MTFKTKTLQITALMILTTSIATVSLMQAYSDDSSESSDRSQYYEEFEEPAISQSLASIESVNPCDTATQSAQCAYLPVASLPNFAADTIESQGGDPASECGNALILSTGNPLNAAAPGGSLSTSMGTPGCGPNPDGFGTFDCVDVTIQPEADSLVLAYSAEWKEFQFSSFTDWMRIGSIVDISINDWPGDAPFIPYGPDGTGTQTLATIAAGETVALRVADSGDRIYDTGLIVVPVACFEEPPPPLICGNGVVDSGEQCDDGNQLDGDGCSAICLTEVPQNEAPTAQDESFTTSEDTTLSGSVTATDPEGDPLTYVVDGLTPAGLTFNSDGTFEFVPAPDFAGTVTFDYKANDGDLDSNVAVVTITVEPVNDAPVCGNGTPVTLWPPNHKMVSVAILIPASDVEGDPLALTVTSILQDEPTNALGDGNTSPDATLSPAEVRSERSGTGDGRVYVITVEASDGNGGFCAGTVEVGVPHSVNTTPVNSGATYDSTS